MLRIIVILAPAPGDTETLRNSAIFYQSLSPLELFGYTENGRLIKNTCCNLKLNEHYFNKFSAP